MVVACEHASNRIPEDLAGLGLDRTACTSHAAYDIGAAHVARTLAEELDAPLVEGAISRVVYDCNRPLSAPDAIPVTSEVFDIPGNRDLDDAARRARFERVHVPFHTALAETCRTQEDVCRRRIALITVHSFTPVYMGQQRDLDIGFLHDATPGFARATLAAERARGIWRAKLNAPYSAKDGVTHTLAMHGEAHGRPSLMVEIRNDLIADEDSGTRMAYHLADTILIALAAPDVARGAAG